MPKKWILVDRRSGRAVSAIGFDSRRAAASWTNDPNVTPLEIGVAWGANVVALPPPEEVIALLNEMSADERDPEPPCPACGADPWGAFCPDGCGYTLEDMDT